MRPGSLVVAGGTVMRLLCWLSDLNSPQSLQAGLLVHHGCTRGNPFTESHWRYFDQWLLFVLQPC